MTAYVDNANIHRTVVRHDTNTSEKTNVARKYTSDWCHLTADSTDELMTFAFQKLGLYATNLREPSDECPHKHFLLTPGKKKRALRAGAVETDITTTTTAATSH